MIQLQALWKLLTSVIKDDTEHDEPNKKYTGARHQVIHSWLLDRQRDDTSRLHTTAERYSSCESGTP